MTILIDIKNDWKTIAKDTGPILTCIIPFFDLERLAFKIEAAGGPLGLCAENFVGVKFILLVLGLVIGSGFPKFNNNATIYNKSGLGMSYRRSINPNNVRTLVYHIIPDTDYETCQLKFSLSPVSRSDGGLRPALTSPRHDSLKGDKKSTPL